jgi:hypothetical protein
MQSTLAQDDRFDSSQDFRVLLAAGKVGKKKTE